jgi:hypothetical protein
MMSRRDELRSVSPRMFRIARVWRSGIRGGEYGIGSHGQRKVYSESGVRRGFWVLVTVEDVAHVEDVKFEVVGEGDMLEGWSCGLRDPQREREITECSVVGGKRAVVPWLSGSLWA